MDMVVGVEEHGVQALMCLAANNQGRIKGIQKVLNVLLRLFLEMARHPKVYYQSDRNPCNQAACRTDRAYRGARCTADKGAFGRCAARCQPAQRGLQRYVCNHRRGQ